jgi:4-aminobutyrate---pyruvate transaminase
MDEAAEDGLLVRAIGDTIAFAPPLISTAEEVSMMVDVFMRTYQSVRSGVRPPAR